MYHPLPQFYFLLLLSHNAFFYSTFNLQKMRKSSYIFNFARPLNENNWKKEIEIFDSQKHIKRLNKNSNNKDNGIYI